MADIGGVGAFGFGGIRSNPAAELQQAAEEARERRLEDEQRRATTEEALQSGDTSDEDSVRVATEADAENQAGDENAARRGEDSIELSREAETLLANDNQSDDTVVLAAGESTALGRAERTNQEQGEADTSAEVDGNRDDQNEQSRTLGQVVDQFA